MTADSIFLHIETAAHGGAFEHNPIPTPTEAQCQAGNYKMGRVSLYGLSLAIEQPRGTYRTGIDTKTNKRWSSRMAAHYGYISGTKGADGDGVDCFVGFYPQSETAYVVNQNVDGRFDEHKAFLAFPDEESARRAYLDSYERGWNGLESIVTASISQLKWWLKHGDMRKPLRAENLPHEGLETMTRKTQWNGDALPYDQTLDQVLYDIRCADAGESLLLDAVSVQDIIEDSDGALAFDALVTPFAKLERKMEVLNGVMERTGQAVKPVSMQITDPFKQRGVANVAVIFELSDGQTVSIFFHNPDVTPNKMAGTDELISWKWLLNKKDITIVVAPERGQDLNVREVARRIMKLAEKNSPAFQRANGKRTETMQRIGGLKEEIGGLEKELASAQRELEVAKVEAEDRAAKAPGEIVQEIRAAAYVQGMESFASGSTRTSPSGMSVEQMTAWYAGWDAANIAAPVPDPAVEAEANVATVGADVTAEIDPTSPEGYVQVMAEEALQLKWQDRLDDFFQGRIVDVRNALRELGWDDDGSRPMQSGPLKKGEYELAPLFKHVGAGRNVVGINYEIKGVTGFFMSDSLTRTAKEMAERINMGIPAATDVVDLTYHAVDSMFTAFYPNTKAGENAWREMAAQNGGDGKVLSIHAADVAQQLRDKGYTVAEAASGASSEDDADAMLSELAQKSDEQPLIDAYVQSWATDAEKINAAVAAVNWDGITDKASVQAEYTRLTEAVRAINSIIPARDALEAVGIKTWDKRLSNVTDTPEFAAHRTEMDEYKVAQDKLQAIAKAKLIESGIAELAALPADAPMEDAARAIYKKHGIDVSDRSDWILRVVTAVNEKNAEALRSILAGVGSDSNKASMEIFERAAGFKLAKTQKERAKQIDEWAGITPEQRAEKESGRGAAQQAMRIEENVKGAWGWVKNMNVRDGSDVIDGQQYLLRKFGEGYDETTSYKKGVATVYGMKKGSYSTSVKNKSFNAFLKAAMAFGGLRKALELVGAMPEEKIKLTGKELGDFPDTEEGKKALRKAAKSFLMDMRGEFVECPILGRPVEIRKRGIIETIAFSANPKKLKLVPAIKSLISTSKSSRQEDNHKKEKKPDVIAYYLLKNSVLLDGDSLNINVLVEEDRNGVLHYDLLIDEEETKTALDSSSAASVPKRSQDNNSWHLDNSSIGEPQEDFNKAALGGNAVALDAAGAADLNLSALLPNEPSLGQRYNDSIGEETANFNEDDFMVDENEIGETFEAEEIALDSASGGRMVFNLFIDGEEPEVVEEDDGTGDSVPDSSEQPVGATNEDATKALTTLRPFLSSSQMQAVADAMRGEEKQFFFDKVVEMAGIISAMPKTYEQDGMGDAAIAHLHYFKGGADWYITEKDMEAEQLQAFGLADLGYGGEMGYISIVELVSAGVELDFHFTPKTIGQITGKAIDEGELPAKDESAPDVPDDSGPVERLDPETAPDQDTNIGREWDSVWGRQRIVERKSHPTGDLYVVQTVGSETIRQYSVGSMEDNIKRQEYALTPEYAAEQAEKEEVRKLKAERDARIQEEKERIDAEIAAFTDVSGMAPPNAERARTSLTKNVSRNGQITNLKSLIEEEVADGGRVTGSGEDRRLSTEDGTFWTVKIINKTGMDYAEYLIAKRDAPPAAKSAPLPPPVVIAQASTEAPAEDPQMTADRALFQSIIDNTVPDILDASYIDQLEAAYMRHIGNAEMEALFVSAVNAYTAAELAASATI